MAAGTSPIFVATPNVGGFTSADGNGGTAGPLKTANTAMDGTGTVLTVFTAGANGAFIERIRVKAAGTNSQASVLRIFVNNGSSNGTIANNIFIEEISLAASTASNTNPVGTYEIPLNIAIQGSYKINVTLGTTLDVGVFVSVFGGDY